MTDLVMFDNRWFRSAIAANFEYFQSSPA